MKIKSFTKIILLVFTSILPFNKLRVFFFRNLFKYNIDENSFIALFVFINCEKCEIKNSKIYSFNYIKVQEINFDSAEIKNRNIFKDFKNLTLINQISIGKNNKIYGNYPISQSSNFIIKKNCSIGSNNFFDLSNSIKIEDKCEILNFCQIWTHGFNSRREIYTKEVFLENFVKIENCVTIISNVKISNNCVIKVGSIVAKSIENEGIYSSNELIMKHN